MKLLFSTNIVHPRDRLAFWREEAIKVFVRHEFSTHVGRKFYGEISVASLGGVDLTRMTADSCTVDRTPRCLKGATDDDVLLFRKISGGLTPAQDGRDVSAGSGDVFFLDPRRPFAFRTLPNTQGLVFKIPRSELQARLGDVANFTSTLLPRVPIASLASEFLLMIAERADVIEPSAATKVTQQALDLIALAFETIGVKVAQLSSPRATSLLRLKSIIETNLHDPALRPATVAQAAGISVRYANRLLANEGTSLERYIMLRRLERCRQVLINPAHLSLAASEIAYSHGFAGSSHFTRRFKKQFGCTPNEIRRKPR